jgi:O-antigen biosynthesis protein WbqP
MKRVFDIFQGGISTLILTVPVLLLAMAVRLTSKGPALYWSERVGQNNMIFKMPKFCSMRVGTPAVATHLPSDSRSHQTSIGSFLRKSSFDKLPQLLSILIGDMGFVGPRPELFNQLAQQHVTVSLSGKRNWQYHLWDVLIFQALLENQHD